MHGRPMEPGSLVPAARSPSPLDAGIEALLEAERLTKTEGGLFAALLLARAALRHLVVATLLDGGEVSADTPEATIWEKGRLLFPVGALGEAEPADGAGWFDRFVVAGVGDVALSEVPASERRALVKRMLDHARELARPLDKTHNGPVRSARRRRKLKLALGVVAVLFVGVGLRVALAPKNLARGKPVAMDGYTAQFPHPPEGLVDGDQLNVGFHSDRRMNPTVTIDLGSVQSISRIEVFNRPDCCQERSVPINVQVSVDGNEYVTLRREEHTFYHMTVRFGSRPARYVRLLRNGREFFHLSEVEVY